MPIFMLEALWLFARAVDVCLTMSECSTSNHRRFALSPHDARVQRGSCFLWAEEPESSDVTAEGRLPRREEPKNAFQCPTRVPVSRGLPGGWRASDLTEPLTVWAVRSTPRKESFHEDSNASAGPTGEEQPR